MANKTSFFESSLFRFLTQPDVISNINSMTADDFLAYYQQENPSFPFQKLYDTFHKDLEQAVASDFFSEHVIDILQGIRDNWDVSNLRLSSFYRALVCKG